MIEPGEGEEDVGVGSLGDGASVAGGRGVGGPIVGDTEDHEGA